jgi:hypothetical protein
MTKQEEPPVLQPMLSLASAAQLVYQAATKLEDPDEQTLNNVARVIAMGMKVFVCEPGKNCSEPDLLMYDEIVQGDFEGGGVTLTFNDGRPSLANLCMRHADLLWAIAETRAVYGSEM